MTLFIINTISLFGSFILLFFKQIVHLKTPGYY